MKCPIRPGVSCNSRGLTKFCGLLLLGLFVCLAVTLPAWGADGVVTAETARVNLVRGGQAVGAVVIPVNAPPSVRRLADDFIAIVARSTGAKLSLYLDTQTSEIAAAANCVFLGACQQTAAAGLRLADLAAETYQLTFQGSSVFILGEPAREILRPGTKADPWFDSDPMRWAVNHILFDELGVRWLWPGHLGTYVPKSPDFSIPAIERTYRPRLKMRTLVIATMRRPAEQGVRAEALEWVSNHEGGERDDIPLAHGFNDWWEKYHVSHPDYFAQPPKGVAQRPARYVKLSLSNPKVLDQIVENYEAAGKPKYWNVTPNDGSGFDISDAVRAWDIPPNQPIMDIWTAQANLTARYVKWWNMIYERLARVNPDVELVTMAYSCYRASPPPERPLNAKAIVGIVPSYRAFDVWEGWASQADELILRPNWGHYGANGPHLPLKEFAAYMKFAYEHKMVGFYLDSILGFWGTQGVNYYLFARLMVDPNLPVDTIVKEYASAFGAGAPKIEEYIRLWEQVSAEWAHGHKVNKVPEGKYDALIREGKIMDNPLIGPRQALPFIYTDDVLAKADALLDEAVRLIGSSDQEATARVDFLRQGLKELKATRDCLVLGREAETSPSAALLAEFKKKADALEELRVALTPSHVIWGQSVTQREDKIKIKIRPRNMTRPASSGDDQF